MTKQEREALIQRFEADSGLDLRYLLDNEEYSDIDSLLDDLREQADEAECIYYNNAMEYLGEHDPSLQYSLGIAHDMGYTADKLNSELLATLLMQQNTRETIEEYADELADLIDSTDD